MTGQPKISIILPVFNPPELFLRECLDSVLAQTYPDWELCIADDASTESYVAKILAEYREGDRRIQVIFRSQNGHICRASNSALEMATGEFIALLDHDDVLSTDALAEVAQLLEEHPDADFIYSDEDKIDDRGNLKFPFHKPEWCPDTFLSRMYTCHLGVYRRSLVDRIGGFRVGYEGSQDYDLVLRLTEQTDRIFHIPKILYHWRLHQKSTSSGLVTKPYASQAARQALEDALQRRYEVGFVQEIPGIASHFLIRYSVRKKYLVSVIIIPDRREKLQNCLNYIFTQTRYSRYEVIVIGNFDTQVEVTPILIEWQIREPQRFRYYFTSTDLNDYQLQNEAVCKAKGEYLLFLSSELAVETPDWLEALLEQAQRKSIAAVGALILDRNCRVFHAGIILNDRDIERYSHRGLPETAAGYFGDLKTINNVSAVSGKCLMCRRDVFEDVGGFDEELGVAYGDIDLCLKFRSRGYYNLYLPHVRLIYSPSENRDARQNIEWQRLRDRAATIVRQRWHAKLDRDPCSNPNLTRYPNRSLPKLQPNLLPNTFIITGMHRSGTSLMASVFDKLGVTLGNRLLKADRFNAAGYFEDLDFLNLQRSILQASGSVCEAGWMDWGWNGGKALDKGEWQNYLESAATLIQSRQCQLKSWGWKDPRTSLMLNFWHGLLPDARYLFVYRVPWEVSDSVSRLNHPFFQEHPHCAIEIWHFYNRRILKFYQQHPDRCILVGIDGFSQSPNQFLDILQGTFSMEISDETRSQIGEIFQPHLFHPAENISSKIRLLQKTAPECLQLLAQLDKFADIPSQVSWENELENLAISAKKLSPLISVIIPCFNHGEFLEEAIQSIEEYPESIYEIIIVNDGSTDEMTRNAIADLKQRGYTIIEQTNQGLATARNVGIDRARGEYILPLDADNKIRSNYIEKGISILQKYPKVGVVYGNACLFGEDSGIFQVPDFNLYRLLRGNYIDACAMFRKQVWQDCGGYDAKIPEKLGYEDWDFWLSAVDAGWEFYHLREVTFEYRVRHDSMVAACNLPENRQKLFRYICNKHLNLFISYLPELLAEKEATALKETRRGNLLASQIDTLQSHITSRICQNLERQPQTSLRISQSPLISLCIPTYNGEQFLQDALSSAFAQTYPHLEIILSDDRSDDRTLEIAESFREYNDISYTITSHDRSGLAENWNHCLDIARGDYIKFLFQDDILEPDCVEKMLELADCDREIGLVFSPRLFLLEKGVDRIPSLMQFYRNCRQSHFFWSKLQSIQPGLDLLSDPDLMENPINKIGEPSTVLLRKSIFERVGKFDSELSQFVDLEMWWRILLSYKVGVIERTLSYFRVHPQQKTYENIKNCNLEFDRLYYKLATHKIFNKLPASIKTEAFCRYLLSTKSLTLEDRERLERLIQKLRATSPTIIQEKYRREKIERLLHKISQKYPEIPSNLN